MQTFKVNLYVYFYDITNKNQYPVKTPNKIVLMFKQLYKASFPPKKQHNKTNTKQKQHKNKHPSLLSLIFHTGIDCFLFTIAVSLSCIVVMERVKG